MKWCKFSLFVLFLLLLVNCNSMYIKKYTEFKRDSRLVGAWCSENNNDSWIEFKSDGKIVIGIGKVQYNGEWYSNRKHLYYCIKWQDINGDMVDEQYSNTYEFDKELLTIHVVHVKNDVIKSIYDINVYKCKMEQ